MHYKLVDKEIIPVENMMVWAEWYETAERHIGSTQIGDQWISTVFLGIDHRWNAGEPILFETMVFDLEKDEPFEYYQTRCCDYEQAVVMHGQAIVTVKKYYLRGKFNGILKAGFGAIAVILLIYLVL